MLKIQFDITKSCGDAINQQILAAFHNYYVKVISNTNFGFTHTTTLAPLNYLYDLYGTITPTEMECSTITMFTPYYPYYLIIKLFIKTGKWVQISDAANTPFTNAQIISKAYILFHKTWLYSERIKIGITVQQ